MASSFENPEPIEKVLSGLFSKLGIADGIKQQQAMLVWSEVVGPTIANISQPVRIEHGKLYVEIENNTWRHEIFYYKRQIINRLNKKLKRDIVKDIVFV